MSITHYQSLINQGRKAGLNTNELYRALSSRTSGGASRNGGGDSNGYTPGWTYGGQVYYRPVEPATFDNSR